MRLNTDQFEGVGQVAVNYSAADAQELSGPRVGDDQRGFTLVELITVIIIVGILAAIVAPRFMDTNVFQSRGFADQVQASLRYAQKEAIAQRRFVCVAFTGNSIALSIGTSAACGTALASPAGGPYQITAPNGITFASVPTNFSFNALGVPTNAPQTISITGAANSINIEAETGYVHSP